ncbi:DUF2802 domain-containing protein [Thiobaca trueperi]|uniref:Uncharacterized protein DUF2802 n=1 Tax=Thiobaca trueperi TaxID=127458 RepID=A0A4R3N2J1_9GAMM|nr:DUF2802 domain-containing protein [Thiobaca trueperi]TCT21263.1 uncharacterized protein DUF2802 [Thiobaca trueperi]
MNDILTFGLTWLPPVVAVLAMILAVSALFSISALRRQLREIRRDVQRQNTSLLALHGAMKVIAEDVIAHAQTQSSVRRTLERLTDGQSELRLRDVDEGLYPQAIQMIHDGRSREEVRRLCGLTQSEVDLLFSLHAQDAASGGSRAASRRH